jgi:tetratricopeptide (TPR) repeat protein
MFSIHVMAQTQDKATSFFMEGNQHYESGEFLKAKSSYESAIGSLSIGMENADLFYNYANSLFRLQELGPAILYYEKALSLSPKDEDIQASLRYALSQTINKHPAPERNKLVQFLREWHSGYSLNTGFGWLLILLGIASLAGSLAFFLRSRSRFLNYIAVVCVILAILTLPSMLLRIQAADTHSFAIVLDSPLTIYSGPGISYEELAKVHEGTKFKVISTQNGWARVSLANGKGGYVLERALGKI